ncbi:hypothetical protein MINTM015_22600 [Mycobacterium paraintracellulare]|nr:hypothetical protein MINTM015_22600 [Mycobacterium paraintracellulare]
MRHERDVAADICGTSPTQSETGAWQTRNHELGMDRDDTGRCALRRQMIRAAKLAPLQSPTIA